MSIASEITRIQNAKADLKTSIEGKGVTVPESAKIDTYSSYVDEIQTGGGGQEITGQEEIQAVYGENISAGDTVYIEEVGCLDSATYIPWESIFFQRPPYRTTYIEVSKCNKFIVFTGDSEIAIYNEERDRFSKERNAYLGSQYGSYSYPKGIFSPDSMYLALFLGKYSSRLQLKIYKLNNRDSFGYYLTVTMEANSNVINADFGKTGPYLAFIFNKEPYLRVIKINSDNTYTECTVETSPYANQVAFSMDDKYLFVGRGSSPYGAIVYERNGDTFTKTSLEFTSPQGLRKIQFSNDGQYLALVNRDAPRLQLFKRVGDTFNELTVPAFEPSGEVTRCYFDSYNNLYVSDNQVMVFENLDSEITVKRMTFNNMPRNNFLCSLVYKDAYLLIGYYEQACIVKKDVTIGYKAYKSNNLVPNKFGTYLGYAKETGLQGETKTVVKLWR